MKIVNESIYDYLKPKSEEEILSAISHLTPDEMLTKSATNGFVPGIKKAIELGADIHVGNEYTLIRASQKGLADVVKMLLDAGANVHVWNDAALQNALENGHTDVVELLKKHMKK